MAQCLCEGPETNVYVGLGCTKDGGRGRWHRGGPSSPGGNAPSPRNNSLGHPLEVELSGPFLRSVGVVHFQGLLQTPQDQLLVPTARLAASTDPEARAQHSSAAFSWSKRAPFAVTPSELDRTGNKITELARKAPRVTAREGSAPRPGPRLLRPPAAACVPPGRRETLQNPPTGPWYHPHLQQAGQTLVP